MHRSLAYFALFGSSALAASTAKQLFNFTTDVFIENSHLRPNGQLLLSTFDNGRLYQLDPASSEPQAELVGAFPGATAIAGIATTGSDKYAVVGGVAISADAFANLTIYTVEFAEGSPNATISVAAILPDAVLLNGLDSLPDYPSIVLAGDSGLGCIWRIDTDSGAVAKVVEDAALNATATSALPIGINGLKVFNGSVYFTNTARATFGRVPITDDGYAAGDIEIIATLNDTNYGWDDFAIDPCTGVAYVAQPNSAIGSIYPNGTLASIVLGGGNSSVVVGPTSVTLASDNKTVYVTTHGGVVDNITYSGQVVEFTLE